MGDLAKGESVFINVDMQEANVKYANIQKGTRVFLRVDFNVPISEHGEVAPAADYRIRIMQEDISYLRSCGAKIILATHLGRPNGVTVSALRTVHLLPLLEQVFSCRIRYIPAVTGIDVEAAIQEMRDGDILLLENLRFDKREEKNANSLAKEWSKICDVYVNGAFSMMHRQHASIVAITKYLPAYIGINATNEIEALSQSWQEPMCIVIGGIKIRTKIPLMKRYLKNGATIMLGSGIGMTAIAAISSNHQLVQHPLVDRTLLRFMRRLFRKYPDKIYVPTDFKVARHVRSDAVTCVDVEDIRTSDVILDIGDKTAAYYSQQLTEAATILWNGPMGIVEDVRGARKTLSMAQQMTQATAHTVVGGGDTVAFLQKHTLLDQFDTVSTGGGAMLEFLGHGQLPGIKAIQSSYERKN